MVLNSWGFFCIAPIKFSVNRTSLTFGSFSQPIFSLTLLYLLINKFNFFGDFTKFFAKNSASRALSSITQALFSSVLACTKFTTCFCGVSAIKLFGSLFRSFTTLTYSLINFSSSTPLCLNSVEIFSSNFSARK